MGMNVCLWRERGGGGGEGGGDVRVIDIDDRGYFFFNWEG